MPCRIEGAPTTSAERHDGLTDQKDIWGDQAPRQAVADIDRDPDLVASLQDLLGDAGHVFKCHGEGIWSVPGGYKDYYSGRLSEIIGEHPNLAHRLLKTGNRLIKMLTYRAIEMHKEARAKGTTVRDLYRLDEGVTATPPRRRPR